MNDADTEQLPVHRVLIGAAPQRGRIRGQCRCGWSVVGPRRSVQLRAQSHERNAR